MTFVNINSSELFAISAWFVITINLKIHLVKKLNWRVKIFVQFFFITSDVDWQDKSASINLTLYIAIKHLHTALYKGGKTNLNVVSVRPRMNSENIDTIREQTKQDLHVSYGEFEVSLDISLKSINKLLHEHLSLKRFVRIGICIIWHQKMSCVNW